MINFDTINLERKDLKLLNECINEIFECIIPESEDNFNKEYLEDYFPEYLVKANKEELMNVIKNLRNFAKDSKIHKLNALYKYAIYCVFEQFFENDNNCREDFGFDDEPRFHIDYYEEMDEDFYEWLNSEDTYMTGLFEDLDFLFIADLFEVNQMPPKDLCDALGINIKEYNSLLPNNEKIIPERRYCIDRQRLKNKDKFISKIKK